MKNLTAFCFAAVALCLIMISASVLECDGSAVLVVGCFVGGVCCAAKFVKILDSIQKEEK